MIARAGSEARRRVTLRAACCGKQIAKAHDALGGERRKDDFAWRRSFVELSAEPWRGQAGLEWEGQPLLPFGSQLFAASDLRFRSKTGTRMRLSALTHFLESMQERQCKPIEVYEYESTQSLFLYRGADLRRVGLCCAVLLFWPGSSRGRQSPSSYSRLSSLWTGGD
jgi:hypothetical protein